MKYDVISGRFGSGVATAFESRAKSPACQVNRRRPTPRAADLGYATRYFGIYLAWSYFRFDGESTLPPQAANASR